VDYPKQIRVPRGERDELTDERAQLGARVRVRIESLDELAG
jgi:hypothetical protein